MSNTSFTPILRQAYNRYFLKFGNQKIRTPYRINLPFQEDRRKYGKSDPIELRKNVVTLAEGQVIDRDFMVKNQLGIDCSGFAYHTLDYLLKKVKKTNMLALGFPKASSTNVLKLVSRKFTVSVPSFKQIRSGDLVATVKSREPGDQHIMIVLDKTKQGLTLIHSSFPDGVKEEFLSKQDLLHNQPKYKIRRLKALN